MKMAPVPSVARGSPQHAVARSQIPIKGRAVNASAIFPDMVVAPGSLFSRWMIVGPPGGSFRLVARDGEERIPYMESDWVTYYADMADHLLRGTPVPVSAEDGRRVIAVLETAGRSAQTHRSEPVPYP